MEWTVKDSVTYAEENEENKENDQLWSLLFSYNEKC